MLAWIFAEILNCGGQDAPSLTLKFFIQNLFIAGEAFRCPQISPDPNIVREFIFSKKLPKIGVTRRFDHPEQGPVCFVGAIHRRERVEHSNSRLRQPTIPNAAIDTAINGIDFSAGI